MIILYFSFLSCDTILVSCCCSKFSLAHTLVFHILFHYQLFTTLVEPNALLTSQILSSAAVLRIVSRLAHSSSVITPYPCPFYRVTTFQVPVLTSVFIPCCIYLGPFDSKAVIQNLLTDDMLYRDEAVTLCLISQPGGPGCLFWSSLSLLPRPAWETILEWYITAGMGVRFI